MKNSFQPGTAATLQQILKNVIMKRFIETHACKTTIFFKPDKPLKKNKKPPKECNNIVYTYEHNKYEFYKILSIEDDVLTCVKFGVYHVHFPQVPNLNWDRVGVFRMGPTDSIRCILNVDLIQGKALKVCNYIISCPNNILREK